MQVFQQFCQICIKILMDCKTFTLSVCLIVRDEKETIARVLECAKKFADEIIVVDTGSTDGTKEIAKSYTEKVFNFEWCDDFAKARNFSFSKATCDYQMWLDADDIISEENIQKILTLKTSGIDFDVCMCKYAQNFDENGNPHFLFNRERILKRSKNFTWSGRVHEVIIPSGKIINSDIAIEHRKIKQNKQKRNLKIYQKMKRDKVEFSPRELFYYARELYFNGYISSAIKNLKKFIKIPNIYPPDNLSAQMMLSDCFLIKKDEKSAKTQLFNALSSHTPTSELCCKIAQLCEREKDNPSSIFWYECALHCKNNSGFVSIDYSNIIPYIELSRLYFPINYQEAKKYHLLAKNLSPKNKAVIFNEKFFIK